MKAVIEYTKYIPAHSEDKKEIFLLISKRGNTPDHKWLYNWVNVKDEAIEGDDFTDPTSAMRYLFERFCNEQYLKNIHFDCENGLRHDVEGYDSLKEANEDLKQSIDWANQRESEDFNTMKNMRATIKNLYKELLENIDGDISTSADKALKMAKEFIDD